MLQTNLPTIQSKAELKELIEKNEKVAVCCGRMGPMCIPVYDIFEVYQEKYPDIVFRNMDFDTPDAMAIKSLPECGRFNGLPFTVYYRNGKVVKATTSIQNAKQVKDIIGEVFA
jgi:thioredoxin 1